MRGQQYADYPKFPQGCRWAAAFLASLGLKPRVRDRCWCSWGRRWWQSWPWGLCCCSEGKTPHVPEVGRGCAAAKFGLSVLHVYDSAAGRQLGCDLEALPRWRMVLVFCYYCHITCFLSLFLLRLQVMGADLIPEKLKEEFQGEVKCIGSSALSSLVTTSASEFEIKWFDILQDDLCHLDRQLSSETHTPPLAT